MKRYLRYYYEASRLFLRRMTLFRGNFLLDTTIDLLGIGLSLLFYRVLFFNLGAGFDIPLPELYLLVVTVKLVGDLHAAFCTTGTLSTQVQYGTLDSLLLKPMDAFFLLFFGRFNPKALPKIIIDLALLEIVINSCALPVTFISVLSYIVALSIALCVYTAFRILISLGAIVFVRFDAFSSLMSSFFTLSSYPEVIFGRKFGHWLFTYLVPVIVVGNFPVHALLQGMNSRVMLEIAVLAVVFSLASYFATHRLLKHYASASS